MPSIATPLHERVIDERDVTARPDRLGHLSRARPGVALVARFFLASIFFVAGISKFANQEQTVAYMESVGIPYASTLLVLAGLAEVLGALSLVVGFHARTGAAALILFLIPTTVMFHAFWTYDGAEAQMQMVNFLKNLSIMGGLGMICAMGPGRYSFDFTRAARRRRAVRA